MIARFGLPFSWEIVGIPECLHEARGNCCVRLDEETEEKSMGIHIWQDSPVYGCDDNPSFKWYGQRYSEGHIVLTVGPLDTREEVEQALA
jgi:hypothetical protein